MRLLLIALAFAAVALATTAAAETFTSRYAPASGQHAQIHLNKCIDASQDSVADEHHCVGYTYDEEIVARTPDGYRIRYVATGIDGSVPDADRALAVLRGLPLDLDTDSAGVPERLENQRELIEHLRQTMPSDAAGAGTLRLYEQMDSATAASVFARDFAPLSTFQGAALDVGAPRTVQTTMPFPLQTSQTLNVQVVFEIDRVDAAAGRAYAHMDTIYDPESVAHALQAFAATVAPQNHDAAAAFSGAHMQLVGHMEGVLDTATGATLHVHQVRSMELAQSNGHVMRQVETIDIDRTPAPHG